MRKKWLDMWTEVDSGLGSRLRAEVAAMTVSLLPPEVYHQCTVCHSSGQTPKNRLQGAKGIKDKIEDTLSGNPTKEHVHGTTKA